MSGSCQGSWKTAKEWVAFGGQSVRTDGVIERISQSFAKGCSWEKWTRSGLLLGLLFIRPTHPGWVSVLRVVSPLSVEGRPWRSPGGASKCTGIWSDAQREEKGRYKMLDRFVYLPTYGTEPY